MNASQKMYVNNKILGDDDNDGNDVRDKCTL